MGSILEAHAGQSKNEPESQRDITPTAGRTWLSMIEPQRRMILRACDQMKQARHYEVRTAEGC